MEGVPIEMMMVKSFEFVNNGALPLFLHLERALADVSFSFSKNTGRCKKMEREAIEIT